MRWELYNISDFGMHSPLVKTDSLYDILDVMKYYTIFTDCKKFIFYDNLTKRDKLYTYEDFYKLFKPD